MHLLFVCTGNLIRSPLAEHLFRRLLDQRGEQGIAVESAGTHAMPGMPALAETLRAGRASGLDLTAHRARRFVPALVRPDSWVLVMERAHARIVTEQLDGVGARVRLLGGFAPAPPEEIADPIGGPDRAYDACVARIRECLPGLALHLLQAPVR